MLQLNYNYMTFSLYSIIVANATEKIAVKYIIIMYYYAFLEEFNESYKERR